MFCRHMRPGSVVGRVGCTCTVVVVLQVVAVYTAQTALFKTINLFAPEKALVRAERTKGSYGAAPYFLSKVLADLPVAALYPLVFSSIVYPMTNLQPKVPTSAHFLRCMYVLHAVATPPLLGGVAQLAVHTHALRRNPIRWAIPCIQQPRFEQREAQRMCVL